MRFIDPHSHQVIEINSERKPKKMTKSRNLRRIVGASGIALAVASLMLGVGVHADPNPGAPGTPPATLNPDQILAAVGADAFAEMYNNFAVTYNAARAEGKPFVASYDAVNTAVVGIDTIQTKPGCSLTRPNGANAAATAIKANQKSTAIGYTDTYCIDIARMSRSKKSDGSESALTFFALGRDAVTWASIGNGYAPASLTTAQLKDIFTCNVEDWSEVGGQKGAIHVYVNLDSAATYTFFLQSIGATLQNVTDGCGAPGTSGGPIRIQQNDGTGFNGDPQGIAPYSVTKWAAQSNKAPGIVDLRGGVVLGLVNNSINPTIQQVVGQSTLTVLNPQFVSTGAQGRLFYTAVRNSVIPAPGAPANWVSDLFGPSGYFCTNQNELLVPFGITPLGSDTGAANYCGQIS